MIRKLPRREYSKPQMRRLQRRAVSQGGQIRNPVGTILNFDKVKGIKIFERRGVRVDTLRIMELLRKEGLNVEEVMRDLQGNPIIKENSDGTVNVFTKYKGRTLAEQFATFGEPNKRTPTRKTAIQIVRQITNILVKMHELGFTHGHPHGGNITWNPKTRKAGLIDFKLAYEHSLYSMPHDSVYLSGVASELKYFRETIQGILKLSISSPFVNQCLRRIRKPPKPKSRGYILTH